MLKTSRLDSLFGVTFLLVLATVITVSIMQFNRDFDSTTPLTLQAPRAGLLVGDGSAVKLHGVTIGHVDSVHATTAGADVHLALKPDKVHLLPADAGARIVPPTLFGGKYVDLTVPASGGRGTMAAHGVITASSVTVEFNQTFDHLVQLLNAAQPAKVNAALTSLSKVLDGRGAQLGQVLTQINTYLGSVNPELGTLSTDLALAPPVLDDYTALTPDLLATLRNLTTTSDTVQDNRSALTTLLRSITGVSDRTTTFLSANEPQLTTALAALSTPLGTLQRYSAVFPCFFTALAKTGVPLSEAAVGGAQPGLGVLAQFLPPQADYTYPKDLPKVAADTGANCYDLPNAAPHTPFKHHTFDVGPDPYASSSQTPGFTLESLLQLLVGPIQGASS